MAQWAKVAACNCKLASVSSPSGADSKNYAASAMIGQVTRIGCWRQHHEVWELVVVVNFAVWASIPDRYSVKSTLVMKTTCK